MHKTLLRPILIAATVALIASAVFADSNRILMPPPPRYKGVEINGEEHVFGEVYLESPADSVQLKPYGFREFKVVGSAARYKKVAAWWPRSTDLDSLPNVVLGLAYKVGSRPSETTGGTMTTHTGERALNVFVSLNPVRIQVNRFGQIIHEGERRFDYAMPESGEPEALIDGQPYVFGVVFFDAVIDTAALRVLGFHGFRLRKLGSVSDLPMGLRIELDDRPDHVDNRVRCFETWWPMTLDFDRLPDTVVNLFSERVGHPVLLYHEYYGL